jgi:hypothetical protein
MSFVFLSAAVAESGLGIPHFVFIVLQETLMPIAGAASPVGNKSA